MLDKLFGWNKKKEESAADAPQINFGRYSDNNKPSEKINKWNEADAFFKDQKYMESFDTFFEYLEDDTVQNVIHDRNGNEGRFELFQGSKIIRGIYNNNHLRAEATLAVMPQPNVPVMRRLLEMNFNLYYSRFALDKDRLCMRFDSHLSAANPNKLYYGLKELATKADKQDDLLVQDFTMLQATDTAHINDIPLHEKEIKYQFWTKWIKETLDYTGTLDADKFSGGIAYLLLSLAFRLDYLILPKGKLMNELEKVVEIYFRKDERPAQEKNRDMTEALQKLIAKTKEELFPSLFSSKYTFAITLPQVFKTVADTINTSNQNLAWYRDNNYPIIAEKICEYGFSFCQYSYSLPKPITEMFHLFMMVNYSEYFAALGFGEKYYDAVTKHFNAGAIAERIKQVQEKWKPKYVNMDFRFNNLRFDTMLNFNLSFTNEVQFLNMESK